MEFFKLDTIKGRLTFAIVLTVAIAVSVLVVYSALTFKQKNDEIIRSEVSQQTLFYGNILEAKIQRAAITVQSLINVFETFREIPEKYRRNEFEKIVLQTIKNNNSFISVWTSWEEDAIDHRDSMFRNDRFGYSGRFGIRYYRDMNGIYKKPVTQYLEKELREADFYVYPKRNKDIYISHPFFYVYQENQSDSTWQMSISKGIMDGDNFVGVAGADIDLRDARTLFDVKITEELPFFMVINTSGDILSHIESTEITKSIYTRYPDFTNSTNFKQLMSTSNSFLVRGKLDNMPGKYILAANKITQDGTNDIWLITGNKQAKIDQRNQMYFVLLILLGLGALGGLLAVINRIIPIITNLLQENTNVLKQLSTGNINVQSIDAPAEASVELQEMNQALKRLIKGLHSTANFANEIRKGNLNAEFQKLSENDTLGDSLLQMRKSLVDANDAQIAQDKLDEKRNWESNGISLFNEITRKNADKQSELAYAVISNMVKYMNASQGAFFLLTSDETPVLKLIAAFALDRRKHMDRIVHLKEGLVGTCIVERQTIYIKDVPDNYIEISSGLGAAKPNNLLVAPLMHNDEIFGAIEIASFNIMEEYQIKFVETASEIIASTLLTQKINNQTNQLLEQSKIQSQEMAQKEKEMRENMDQLRSAQQRAALNEAEVNNVLKGIDSTFYVVEFDLKGNVRKINDKFLALYELKAEDIIGRNHRDMSKIDAATEETFFNFWRDLNKGKVIQQIQEVHAGGKPVWLSMTYIPIMDNSNIPYKIISIAVDITESKKLERELAKKQIEILEIEKITSNLSSQLIHKDEEINKQKYEIGAIEKRMKEQSDLQIETQQRLMQRYMTQKEQKLQERIKELEKELEKFK